jgi:hypothetical protein
MGLDWNPLGKPKPGHEAEFERLFYQLVDLPRRDGTTDNVFNLLTPENRETIEARWYEIQISPFETVQAPRVGFDPHADAWARQKYAEQEAPDKSEAEFLAGLQGYYVVALAPPCDGLPLYSNGPLGYVELFSFRAQFLTDCSDIIAEELLTQCWGSCLAPDLAALGAELREAAIAFARPRGLLHLEKVYDLDADEGTPESQAHILFSAAKWAAYWSSRGHGMDAYF